MPYPSSSSYKMFQSQSFKRLNNSQVNKSRSKQTHSFSKSIRFQPYSSNCLKQSYEGDIIKRKTSGYSLGKGQRSDFTKSLSVAPGVSKYALKSMFNENTQKQKGIQIGLGRQKVSFGSYLNKQLIYIPSSTKYNVQKVEKKSHIASPSYSLRPKTKILDKTMTIQPQNYNPGPGQYQNPELNYNSKHASKYSTIGYTGSKSKRFDSYNTITPGPGNYKNLANNMSNIGRYVLSNNNGGTKAIFDQSKRVTKFDQAKKIAADKPGPGAYRSSSEFGYYDEGKSSIINNSRMSKRKVSTRNN